MSARIRTMNLADTGALRGFGFRIFRPSDLWFVMSPVTLAADCLPRLADRERFALLGARRHRLWRGQLNREAPQ